MELKALKGFKWAIKGIEAVEYQKDEVFKINNLDAQEMIANNYAVPIDAKPKDTETDAPNRNKDNIVQENKAIESAPENRKGKNKHKK